MPEFVFTGTDKSLLMRAARLLLDQASTLERSYGQNWAADPDHRAAKLEFDRLHRDARDLRALAHRYEALVGPLKKPRQQPRRAPLLDSTGDGGTLAPTAAVQMLKTLGDQDGNSND